MTRYGSGVAAPRVRLATRASPAPAIRATSSTRIEDAAVRMAIGIREQGGCQSGRSRAGARGEPPSASAKLLHCAGKLWGPRPGSAAPALQKSRDDAALPGTTTSAGSRPLAPGLLPLPGGRCASMRQTLLIALTAALLAGAGCASSPPPTPTAAGSAPGPGPGPGRAGAAPSPALPGALPGGGPVPAP